MGVEDLDHLGKICERTGETIDFVDDHGVDSAGADIGQKPLKTRSVHRPAGNAAVIIGCLDEPPAFALLTADEGFAGLALGMQGVEVLFEALFR